MEVCMLLAMWFLWGQGVFRDSVLWACSWLPRRCDSVCVTTCDQSECVICRVIFALGKSLFQSWIWWKFRFLQACVGNFDTIPPWKVVGTYYLDISYVAFKYFDFLSVSDKLELLGHVHEPPWWFECYFRRSSWIHCWLLLAVLTDFIIITFPLCKFRGLPGSTRFSFPVMKRRKCLGMKRSSQPSSRTREASNAISMKSLFHFKPVKVNKFEYCNNLWNKTFFITQWARKLKACL